MDPLDIIGTGIGLVYLYLEYKANKYLWITGIIMPAIYIFAYYRHGLYADMGINIYYLLAAVYGWLVWTYGHKRNQREDKEMPITHFRPKLILPSILVFTVLFLFIAWLLINFTNSNVPWCDSFVTACSIIGMWALARKYLEQWLIWILVDVICCGLYWYKGLPFTSVLYGLYSIIAIVGYFHWIDMMNKQNEKVCNSFLHR